MKIINSISVLLICSFIGCDFILDSSGVDNIQLRIYNNSDYNFKNVRVNGIEFGDVNKYTSSKYHVFEMAYHYGAVELEIADKKFGIYPIDYMGETPLDNGKYTYMISIDFESGRLALTFFTGNNKPGVKQPGNIDPILSIEYLYQATSGKETSDGNIIIAGHKITNKVINPTISNVPGTKVLYLPDDLIYTIEEEPLLILTDNQGNKLWARIIKEDINFYGKKLVDETSVGGFIIAGSGEVLNQREDGSNFWDMNAYCIKTDAEGNTLWFKMYGQFEYVKAHSIKSTPDGGFIISGFKNDATWLLKADANGNEDWSHKLNHEYRGEFVQPTSDNGYIVAGGRFGDQYSYPRSRLTKTDAFGDEMWSNKILGTIWSAYETFDQSYIVAGSIDYRSTMLIKINHQGETEWSKYFDNSRGYSVLQTIDGGYIVSGTKSENHSLIKTNMDGNIVWHKTFGLAADNFHHLGNSVQNSFDGNFLLISSSLNDILLVKMDVNGNTIFEQHISE